MAHRITAPMLMLQGQADRICPIDDNWQLFVALRERDHDVGPPSRSTPRSTT